MNCMTCKFWCAFEGDPGKGECRRRPPQAIVMPMPAATEGSTIQKVSRSGFLGAPEEQNPRFGPVSFWPPTHGQQWCGDFKKRGTP